MKRLSRSRVSCIRWALLLSLLVLNLGAVASVQANSAATQAENSSQVQVLTPSAESDTATQRVTLQSLIEAGHLRINYRIAESALIRYQPITLEVEVATDRWFARGCRIETFDMEHAVVYRAADNSINASSLEAGETWAVQTLSIVIYPQRSGHLLLPELKLFISVKSEDNRVIEGDYHLSEKALQISVPEAMADIDQWLASTSLKMTESYLGLKDFYRPGDAITRTIDIRVDGAPAMMIPALQAAAIEGLAIYEVPSKIADQSNRGDLQGRRQQQFIYTIEKTGSYTLPPYSLHWWNTDEQQMETEQLPAFAFATKGNTVASEEAVAGDKSGRKALSVEQKLIWVGLLSITVLLLIVVWLFKRLCLLKNKPHHSRRQAAIKQIKMRYWQAFNAEDSASQLQCLYELMALTPGFVTSLNLAAVYQGQKHCLQTLNQLQAAAFNGTNITRPGREQARCLIDWFEQRQSKLWPGQHGVDFRLNPASSKTQARHDA